MEDLSMPLSTALRHCVLHAVLSSPPALLLSMVDFVLLSSDVLSTWKGLSGSPLHLLFTPFATLTGKSLQRLSHVYTA